MEFFKTKTKIPFMRQQKAAAFFSALIFVASLVALFMNGLNLGLDFTGGNQVVIAHKAPLSVSVVRTRLEQHGFSGAQVQAYNAHELSIRLGTKASASQDAIKTTIKTLIPQAKIKSFDYIGPTVGQELLSNGILAIVVSLIATMIYIAMRFDYRFALSAAVALIHDPVLILGVFAYFHLTFNMIVLTAILTVIGYSLNDTIVVYDRVRENFRKVRKATPVEIMDLSINQTLSRTIMTSGLTLLVVVALYLYGGPTVHGFALGLMIGIVIGTYSSIYIAGSLAIALGLNRQNLLVQRSESEATD